MTLKGLCLLKQYINYIHNKLFSLNGIKKYINPWIVLYIDIFSLI